MQDYPDMVHSDVASDSYFDTVFQMHAAVANRDYAEAARIVRENLSYIPAWIEETQTQQGFFDIASIPAFELGGTILALVGDEEGILRMRDTVYNIPHLARWVGKIREHRQDMELFKAIEKTVRDNPNCLQTDVHELVGEKDSLRVSNLISYLEKAGKIVRAREGRAYRLVIAGFADSLAVPQERKALSKPSKQKKILGEDHHASLPDSRRRSHRPEALRRVPRVG